MSPAPANPQSRRVRLGVLGLGSMGRRHLEGARLDPSFQLTAVCDREMTLARGVAEPLGAAAFDDAEALLDSGLCEALLVSTPHTRHVVFAAPALSRGIHVLVEKPVAVSIEGGRRLNRTYEAARQKHPNLIFAAMFQQRLMPLWQQLKQLIHAGTLGHLSRVTWVVTDWIRTSAYYAAAGWRGTWLGEGGGVLMNQAPHNLDLLLWLTGLSPKRVTAVVGQGKRHPIETEDEVSAVVEFSPHGDEPPAVGHFITSTGEAPGTNRLEIIGDRGSVVAEEGMLRVRTLRRPTGVVIATGEPKLRGVAFDEEILRVADATSTTFTDQTPFRRMILADFGRAILEGRAPIVPGTDGAASLELANAMLLSGFTGRSVELPLDTTEYQRFLEERIARSEAGKKHGCSHKQPPAVRAALPQGAPPGGFILEILRFIAAPGRWRRRRRGGRFRRR